MALPLLGVLGAVAVGSIVAGAITSKRIKKEQQKTATDLDNNRIQSVLAEAGQRAQKLSQVADTPRKQTAGKQASVLDSASNNQSILGLNATGSRLQNNGSSTSGTF